MELHVLTHSLRGGGAPTLFSFLKMFCSIFQKRVFGSKGVGGGGGGYPPKLKPKYPQDFFSDPRGDWTP